MLIGFYYHYLVEFDHDLGLFLQDASRLTKTLPPDFDKG